MDLPYPSFDNEVMVCYGVSKRSEGNEYSNR